MEFVLHPRRASRKDFEQASDAKIPVWWSGPQGEPHIILENKEPEGKMLKLGVLPVSGDSLAKTGIKLQSRMKDRPNPVLWGQNSFALMTRFYGNRLDKTVVWVLYLHDFIVNNPASPTQSVQYLKQDVPLRIQVLRKRCTGWRNWWVFFHLPVRAVKLRLPPTGRLRLRLWAAPLQLCWL